MARRVIDRRSSELDVHVCPQPESCKEARKVEGKGGKIATVVRRRVRLDGLVPAEYNPRRMSDEAAAGLSRSIEEFGYVEPIVMNVRTGRVVGGHERLRALMRAGYEEADVVEVDLDEQHEKALNLALNNRWIQGEWDRQELRSLLDGIVGETNIDDLLSGLRVNTLADEMGLSFSVEVPEFRPTDAGKVPRLDKKSKIICPKCGNEF